MPKTCQRAIVVPTAHEIELGTAQRQRDIRVGNTYDLAPHCALWMRGAKTARVKRIYLDGCGSPSYVSVEPLVMGTPQRGTHEILLSHFA